MLEIRNLRKMRDMPDGVVKTTMKSRAFLCHNGDEEVIAEMEDEFNGPIGGDWFILENGDDIRNFSFDEGYSVVLLGDE
jgi:hypothetical protein